MVTEIEHMLRVRKMLMDMDTKLQETQRTVEREACIWNTAFDRLRMATEVLDRPVEYIDEGAPIIDDTTDMDNPNGFPESLYLVDIGNGRYGALNVSPYPIMPNDEYKVNAIAVFANQSEGRLYQEMYDQPGEIVNKPFKEVLEIAISKKPVISAIALQHEGRTILVQYIN